ncbi:MAG: YgiT-type zinc finger protein [Microcoleus sp. PH2017_10_PVI_O_A]|uniref:YgiT-type zinc finger protein n=1 Tax=unclassified Microcoleus TaxID=2642155 RepID=UPI001DE1203A|nr:MULTISPECIES: YgiT-type zinc finger protein [unclassified Microcoleus]TAE81795.1 MAG: YgiT-type zinc finger protein [Oscillatoriales cyanobacterium]MCC3406927.1 YgiT-type zinc finger protein [Microcoleus sp. PH2017_10_PVI_O_A]MCC3461023.1 YgiT-type zinc finger protein [Microcoleus sp. PH2017_11_PCY_U_A]MCC3479574.1 YgiT-type zinc finger protein [Microcoleus sp. PH2017_12_PCY_D_A]MCC3526773.1 YgiT-type zinc finger protein [Microcoleus sp. PH2017_21_RUC_O_A]
MFQCHVCGSTEAQENLVDEVFRVNGKLFVVEKIPATVCSRCGEVTFSMERGERVRKMLNGDSKPVKSIEVDVFAY